MSSPHSLNLGHGTIMQSFAGGRVLWELSQQRAEIRRAFELPGGWVSAAEADVIRWPSGSSHPCVLASEGTYLSCRRGHPHAPGATIPSCLMRGLCSQDCSQCSHDTWHRLFLVTPELPKDPGMLCCALSALDILSMLVQVARHH